MTDEQNQKNMGEFVMKMANIKVQKSIQIKAKQQKKKLKPFQLLNKEGEVIQMMDGKPKDGKEVVAE